MKKNSLMYCILLSATLVLTSSKCCDELLVLCDLLVQKFEVPQEITLGTAFDIAGEVINADSNVDCEIADIAGSTLDLVEVFFFNESTQIWDLVGNNSYNQSELGPNEIFDILSNLTLQAAGDYRFDLYVDTPESVEERDENNNSDSQTSGGKVDFDREAFQKTNNFARAYLTVLPLADGTTQIEGVPQVQFNY